MFGLGILSEFADSLGGVHQMALFPRPSMVCGFSVELGEFFRLGDDGTCHKIYQVEDLHSNDTFCWIGECFVVKPIT